MYFVSNEYDTYIICIISAFVLALVAGPVFIPLLTRMKFGQIVRDDGPQSHLKDGYSGNGRYNNCSTCIICITSFQRTRIFLVLITTMLLG